MTSLESLGQGTEKKTFLSFLSKVFDEFFVLMYFQHAKF